MPKIGAIELVIVLVIVLLLFGAGKLPQIGNSLGKSIREFKKAKDGDRVVRQETDQGIVQTAQNVELPKS